MNKITALVGAVASLAMILIQGCSATSHLVIAATETTIGVNISENPATQYPQAKLGYNRAELAIVPTNRSKGESAGSTSNGAADVADVMMELRYGGIFDMGATSGIYQRLAVGKNAVEQPGASLMFAKDASGDLKPEAGSAVQSLSARELSAKHLEAVGVVAKKVVDTSGKADETKLKAFFTCSGFNDAEAARLAGKYKEMPTEDFNRSFARDFGWIAPSYSEKCAKQ